MIKHKIRTVKSQLPAGWVNCQFGDIAKIRNGYAFKSSWFKNKRETESDVPLIRQSQLKTSIVDLAEAVFLDRTFFERFSEFKISKGDILIGMSGAIGKVCTYTHTSPSLQNQRTGKIELHACDTIDRKYLGLFLSNIEPILLEKAKGMGVQNISGKDICNLPFPMPPFNEQRRIVAKIDRLFSELDKGIESLKAARAKLNVYRQSVLKHAFEGKLTAQWREENKDKLVTPEQLLTRIEHEREARYQQKLKEWRASGKKSNKPKTLKPLPLLTAEELAELPELPEGWCWTRFGLLDIELKRGPFGSSITKSMFVPSGFKVYEQGNAIYCDVLRGHYFVNKEKYEELSGFSVVPGDFIVSCAGTVGRIFELPSNAPAGVINQALMRVRINGTILSKRFFENLFESAFFQRKVLSDAKGTAMVNLAGIKELNLVPVAICNMREQRVTDELLDARLSDIDQCERTIATSLQQAESLRQSILRIAFSGQLVAQDPSDEPAFVLPAQIRAEKGTAVKNKPTKKTRQRKTTA